MKKRILLFIVLFALILHVSAQKSTIIEGAFRKYVEYKISSVQNIISISNEQAAQLKDLEFNFLIDVNNTGKCFLYSEKKQIKKLQKNRDERLQQILTREQYIKYNSIDNDLIKNDIPLQLQE